MSSTIGYEKKYNPYMQIDNFEEFRQTIQNNAPPIPAHYPVMKKLNAKGPAVFGHTPEVRALSASEFEQAAKTPDAVLLDTRDMLAFGGGHIKGALNIGLQPILSVWAGWLIDTESPIYLILNNEEKDLDEVVNLLWRIGHTNIQGYLAGGMTSWREAGKELSQLPQLSVHDFKTKQEHFLTLDLRKDEEWASGHLPDATHIFR